MADENTNGPDDIGMLVFVFGGFAALVAVWYFTGGPARADLRGIFLQPPAPINTGDAYGPEISAPKNNSNNTNQQ